MACYLGSMQTALEKLITIIRLVHEAAPDMPITVHFEGEARGKGYVVDLVDEASTADAHLRQLLDERRDIPNEAAPFLAVLARVHEVFVNLAPGRAGRLGGAWHLFNAGWRAEMTVDDAHRLLDRQREWRDIDQWRAWAVSLTRSGAEHPDADLRRYISERIETLKGLVEEYRKARQAELVAELCRRRETEHS